MKYNPAILIQRIALASIGAVLAVVNQGSLEPKTLFSAALAAAVSAFLIDLHAFVKAKQLDALTGDTEAWLRDEIDSRTKALTNMSMTAAKDFTKLDKAASIVSDVTPEVIEKTRELAAQIGKKSPEDLATLSTITNTIERLQAELPATKRAQSNG